MKRLRPIAALIVALFTLPLSASDDLGQHYNYFQASALYSDLSLELTGTNNSNAPISDEVAGYALALSAVVGNQVYVYGEFRSNEFEPQGVPLEAEQSGFGVGGFTSIGSNDAIELFGSLGFEKFELSGTETDGAAITFGLGGSVGEHYRVTASSTWLALDDIDGFQFAATVTRPIEEKLVVYSGLGWQLLEDNNLDTYETVDVELGLRVLF